MHQQSPKKRAKSEKISDTIEDDYFLDDSVIPLPQFTYVTSCIIVTSFSLACFWSAQNATFTFDDNSAILSNKDIQTGESLWRIFENDFWGTHIRSNVSHKSYRPLTVLTYRLNYYASGGYHPWGFHAVNVVLHTLNSILLLRLFSVLFGGLFVDPDGRTIFTAPRASLLGAVLFAIHPVHTESVVAVVGRADLLCCFFFILSFLQYIQLCHQDEEFSEKKLFTCILYAATSMFSKEQGITVFGVCVAYDVLMVQKIRPTQLFSFLGGEKVAGKNSGTATIKLKRSVVMTIAAISLLLVRLGIMGNTTPKFQYQDNPASFQESVFTRILNYLYLYSLNLWLLLSPWWLCFDWAMGCIPVITSFTDIRLCAPLLLITVVILFCAKIVLHIDSFSGRFLAFSLCFLLIPFVPAMNIFFRVGFVIAERNLYISSAGFVAIVVFGVAVTSNLSMMLRQLMKVFLAFLVVIFVGRSIHRTNDWLNEYNLFTSGAKVCPLNAKVHYNIGKVSQDSGDIEKAIESYKEAIRLSPDYDQPMNNLANMLKDQKKYEEAEYYLERAVKVSPFFATGWMNLAIVKNEMKKKEEANRCYAEAVRHKRNYPDAFYNWGNHHIDYKEFKEALEKFERAIQLKPDHLLAWQNKITLLGNVGTAEDLLQEAKRISQSNLSKHDNIWYLIGNSLGKFGKFKESTEYLNKAISLNPRNSDALGSLGVVYHHLKQYHKAEKYYKDSLRLNPNNQGMQTNYQKLQKTLNKQKRN